MHIQTLTVYNDLVYYTDINCNLLDDLTKGVIVMVKCTSIRYVLPN